MTTKDTLGVRVVKHGLCAVTMAALLMIAFSMVGRVFEYSVADLSFHAQSVNTITIND